MNYIGSVIKAYRNALHLSRKALSADICSEKYLYLIEKGDRTPSSEVTRLLGDRMGVDLFKYYEYLDCAAPVEVCALIESFYLYRRESDYERLLKASGEALSLQDFHKEPWRYEIEINRLAAMVFAQNKFLQAIPVLTELIANMKQTKMNTTSLLSLYVLLSTCYQMARDVENARKIVLLADEAVRGRQHMSKYVYIAATVKINKITMHYLAGDFAAVIEDALDLIQYEKRLRYNGFSDHAFFYLAFAYFQTGREEIGIQWFHKALRMMLVSQNAMDMSFIMGYEIFDKMVRDQRVSPCLIQEFENQYQNAAKSPAQSRQ